MMAELGSVLHTLHPGGLACGGRGDRFATLLGSCVAVVLTDPRRTVGAMCHIVHSTHTVRDIERDSAWGDIALDLMYEMLHERGIAPRLCQAYVYGGGNMFPGQSGASDVGANNAQWVLEALALDGIRVLHQDVGGTAYRRLSWTVGLEAPRVTAVPVAPTSQGQP